jgi:hypothetical protein
MVEGSYLTHRAAARRPHRQEPARQAGAGTSIGSEDQNIP